MHTKGWILFAIKSQAHELNLTLTYCIIDLIAPLQVFNIALSLSG